MDLVIKKLDGYELINSGDGRKLERFGKFLLDRPASQAIWPKEKKAPWNNATATYSRGVGGTGDWEVRKSIPESWLATINDLTFEIKLTGFGNVGLFPEHLCHWSWMTNLIKAQRDEVRMLNLFAYTGGASVVCAKAGAKVTHVDAAKSVNGWAMQNAKKSNVKEGAIRYLADDAYKFIQREQRRGNRYDAIILDPPTFGRGAKGEVWKIERDFYELAKACLDLLSDNPLFLLATSHSPGVTPTVLKNLFGHSSSAIESGEMLIKSKDLLFPAGCYTRLTF